MRAATKMVAAAAASLFRRIIAEPPGSVCRRPTQRGATRIVHAVLPTHLADRLQAIEVSALCDADKTLPVCDPGIRAMVPGVRMAGPALTVTAEDDHLPVMSALAEAEPGEVLVIATNGGRLAVLGELFATEARRDRKS